MTNNKKNLILISLINAFVLSIVLLIIWLFIIGDSVEMKEKSVKADADKADTELVLQENKEVNEEENEDKPIPKTETKKALESNAVVTPSKSNVVNNNSNQNEFVTNGEFIYFISQLLIDYQLESADMKELMQYKKPNEQEYVKQSNLKVYNDLMEISSMQKFITPRKNLTAIFTSTFDENAFISNKQASELISLFTKTEFHYDNKKEYITKKDLKDLNKQIRKEFLIHHRYR